METQSHLYKLADGRVIHALPSEPIRSDAVLVHRHMQARRRAAAMCTDEDFVLGLRLRAMTPASYSRLFAIGSPFLARSEANQADVRNYVWFHSPEFTTAPELAGKAKEAALARLDMMIASPWMRWRLSRQRLSDHIAAGYAIAIANIREIVTETFADNRGSGKEMARPLPATLEAQMVDGFSSEYARWPFETSISDTPLRKLYQLMRCQGFRYGGVRAIDEDPEEIRLLGKTIEQEIEEAKAAHVLQEDSPADAKEATPCH